MDVEASHAGRSPRLQHDNSDMTHLLVHDKSERTVKANFALLRPGKVADGKSGDLYHVNQ